ncbi:MFS transporter [Streptomyces sp. NPDC060194]|uniref:MFS transporter n=1 Tax=Streptomyces sp. NPDC060194 TaxID=3347069 RepID=UPI003662DA9B
MVSSTDSGTRRWRAALFLFNVVVGVGMSSWIARTPAIRDALDVSTGAMGLVLFGLSVGSMTGVLASGGLVRRFGGQAVIRAGAVLLTCGIAVVAAGAALSVAPGVFCGLALFGGGLGLAEVAFNIEGAALEKAVGRPVLPVLHGCFSLGTVGGALLGMALTAADVPVGWHLGAVTVVVGAAAAWAVSGVPAGTGKAAAATDARPRTTGGRLPVWLDRRLVLIGLIVLAMALAEGAANDWLPLVMVDGHGTSATAGSLVYTAFAASMTVGRFAGGPLLARYGRAAVVRVSALAAAAGLALVIFPDSPAVATAGVVLWGLGAALGFPVTISAAGDDPHHAAARVSAVATAGYVAFLVGPPALGLLADHVGLRNALIAVLALVVGAAFLTSVMRSAPRGTVEGPSRASGAERESPVR